MIPKTGCAKSLYVLTPTLGKRVSAALAVLCCLFLLPDDLPAQVTEISTTKLSLFSPAGGETFKPGDTVTVVWGGTRNELIDTVQIDLSGDNGVSWQTVAEVPLWASFQPDTIYSWVVPSVACRECLLRIRQVTGFMGAGDTLDRFDIPVIPLKKDERLEAIFSDTDSLLVIRTDDTISVWDVIRRERISVFSMPSTDSNLQFEHIFANNDAWMVVGTRAQSGEDTTHVFIWDVRSGDLLYQFPVRVVQAPNYIYAHGGTVSPDADKVIIAGMSRPFIRGLPEENVLGRLDAGYGYSADFSPDGQSIVVGGTRYLTCWDAVTLEQKYLVDGESFFVQFSGDGKHILSHPYRLSYNENQSLRILDTETGDTIFTVRTDTRFNPLARFARASQRFIIEGRVYDLGRRFRTYWPMLEPMNDTTMHSFAVTPSGSIVADVSERGVVVLMDITQEPTVTMTTPFTITGTLPVAGNRYLGPVELGETHDTLIAGFIGLRR